MRILPESDSHGLNINNFETYSALNDNSGESTIQVDSSTQREMVGVVTKKFNIAKSPTGRQSYFEIVYPQERNFICIKRESLDNPSDINIPIAYIFQDE